MGLKQKAMGAVFGQFLRPHGFRGRAAGWVMATRGSNRERNIWAVGLLDVQPDDRVLEIGFGPGIAIVYQPRGPGSTNEVAARTGQEIAAHFTEVGFTEVHVETLALKPTAVVCVLGVS